MITIEFTPEISDESIHQALDIGPENEYPETVLQDKAEVEAHRKRNKIIATIIISAIVLLSGFSIILSLIKPDFLSRDRLLCGSIFLIGLVVLYAINRKPTKEIPPTLEMAVKTFYSYWLGPANLRDSFKRYLVLAPGTMEKFSEDEFVEAWEQVENELMNAIKNQDFAACAFCNKISNGLWLPEKLWLKGEIYKEAKLFFECPDCKTVYCAQCYTGFQNKHQCPSCGKQLQLVSEGVRTLMQENPVKIKGVTRELRIEEETDRIAKLVCEMGFSSTYRRLSPPATLYGAPIEDVDLDLGEKGNVVYRFHNIAVKIGENWRLLSAVPFSSISAPAQMANSSGIR